MIEGFDGALVRFMDLTQRSISENWATVIANRFSHSDSRARIVDVGCGSGLLLERLSRLGFEVAGLDSSEEMIQLSLLRLGERARLHRVDVARDDVPLIEADLAVCVNGVANCFGVGGELRAALANTQRMIRRGGALWIEVFTLDYLRQLADQSVIQECSDFSLFMRCIWLDKTGELLMRLSGTVGEGENRKAFDNLIRYRYIDPDELLGVAGQAGLRGGRQVDGSVDVDRVCWEFTAD